MAIDYFVYLKKDTYNKANLKDIKIILEDYLGDLGTVDNKEKHWLIATLPGKPSFPFKRFHPELDSTIQPERWFEVVSKLKGKKPYIDVITRMQDEFTNVVAKGFAEIMARYYQSEVESG